MNVSVKSRFLNFLRQVFKIPALEAWLVKRTNGRSPRDFFCKLVPNPYQYDQESERHIIRNEIKLKVNISDYVGHYVYFGFRDLSTEKLFSLCEPGFNVLDIGSNLGWVALNLASISQSGQVVGFEPDHHNFLLCRENVSNNSHITNLTILPIALGDEASTRVMEIRSPGNRGGNRVAPLNREGHTSITIMKLDEIDHVRVLGRIDLIKIDVEGFELKVLNGARETLKRFRPILFVEVDEANLMDQGDNGRGLIKLLNDLGYREIFDAESNEPITLNSSFEGRHFDIVAR